MSTLTTQAPVTTTRDTRTLRRVGGALLLPLGPLAVAALRAVLPNFSATDSAETISQTAAHLGRQDAVLWFELVALLALIPSVLAAGRLAQRRAPVLSLLAVGLLVPAFAALPFFAGDTTVRVLADGTADPRTAATLLDHLNALGPVAITGIIFIAGHVIGMVLLGAALWRAHAVPVWAAIAVLVSQPLHFVAFVIVGNQALDAFAWGLTALGLAVAAVRVLRTPNDVWDVAPVS
jgi:hypothetical protein